MSDEKSILDIGVISRMEDLPFTVAAGTCGCTDERGAHRFLYVLGGATAFWRYDAVNNAWGQLASPATITYAAGTDMVFDPSQGDEGCVWLFSPLSSGAYCTFQKYDIATGVWSSKATPAGLGSQWAIDASLTHTCSRYASTADDDKIYLIGNNSTTWYSYDITDNAWTTMTSTLPAAAGAGCNLQFEFGLDADKILYLRGTASSSIYEYTISTDTFGSAITYVPSVETFTTGTSAAYNGVDKLFIQKDATKRLYYYCMSSNKLMSFGSVPQIGTASVGNRLFYVKSANNKWLYFINHSTSQMYRFEIMDNC